MATKLAYPNIKYQGCCWSMSTYIKMPYSNRSMCGCGVYRITILPEAVFSYLFGSEATTPLHSPNTTKGVMSHQQPTHRVVIPPDEIT